MKTQTLLFCCLFATGFIVKSNAQKGSTPMEKQIEFQVDSAFHAMVKAAETLDAQVLTQGVDDWHHAGFITNGSYYSSFDSLMISFGNRSRGIVRQNISIQKEKISVLSQNLALLTACGSTKADASNGNSFTMQFLWTFVYEKINNQWKVIQSHQSIAQ